MRTTGPNTWLLLQSVPGDAAWNMALDEALLEDVGTLGAPVLRFYGWTERAASFGYSQRYAEIAQVTRLRPLVRRPTGGGLVPHDADWTYCLVFPPAHSWHRLKAVEGYERVHAWIRDAFGKMEITTELSPCCVKEMPGQCFNGAEKFDLLWHGRKIAGAAQRRNRHGLLVQGSVQPPPIGLAKADWQKAMCAVAHERFGVTWESFELPGGLARHARELADQKYSRAEFNQRR